MSGREKTDGEKTGICEERGWKEKG